MKLATLLKKRTEELGITPRQLHQRLQDRGVDRKERAVYEWFYGGALTHDLLEPLADALELTAPEEREQLARAAGFGGVLDLVMVERTA